MNERDLFRHTLATLAYRGGKCLRGAPENFPSFRLGEGMTALEILSHMGDLLDWALSKIQGDGRWHKSVPGTWMEECARFHQGLERLDSCFTSELPSGIEWPRILQGPLADALTHVGQLAMLRRLAGSPIKGENYFAAEVVAGRLGPEQALPGK